ncbi:MAG: DsbE family thiol:disulfide interchange protein [Alphaproteobacteria bacterium]|nr:DsbE family thiol:disulfide interchange protein [Alphaproteobacteria bacterium]
MKRLWAFAPLAALLVFAAAAAVLLINPRNDPNPISETGLVGQAAPIYDLPALAEGGAAVTPAAFAGRPYVVNFFASWCEGCLVEHPLLMAMKAAGAPILGVAYKDDPARTARFLARHGDPFETVGLDPEGRLGLEFGTAGMPETFVVGADGRILALHRGALTEEIVRSRIMPALRAGAATN